MSTLSLILDILGRLWRTGNRITRNAMRWTLAITAIWIVMIAISVMYNSWAAIFVASLMPVALLVIRIAWMRWPLVLGVLAIEDNVRTFFRWIWTLIGAQLFIGVYLMLVDVSTDPKLALVMILSVLSMAFLNTGRAGRLVRTANIALTTIIVAITIIFVLGGRGKIEKWWTNNKPALTTAQAAPKQIVKTIVLKGNDQWSEPVTTTDIPVGYNYRFRTSPRVTVKFGDGTEGSALDMYGVKDGPFFFKSPSRDTVIVRFFSS